MTCNHVLVTSAAAKVALIRAAQDAVRRLDPGARVVAGDSDPGAPSRHVADAFWEMPRAAHGNVNAILAGCRDRGIGVVLPTRDGELAFWADVRARFADEGIAVIVCEAESAARCLDKLAFARFADTAGFRAIPAALTPEGCGPGPYVVKERFGAGSGGIGLKLDRAAALAHAERLAQPIFQPFVAGTEISIDGWMDRFGTPHGVVARRRDRVMHGESQVTTTFRAPAIEAEAASALRALALRGPAVMQAILGEDGGMQVIEVNARFGGASTAAIAAGLDMLYWSLAETLDPVALRPFTRIAGEIRQVRVAQDLIIHDPGL